MDREYIFIGLMITSIVSYLFYSIFFVNGVRNSLKLGQYTFRSVYRAAIQLHLACLFAVSLSGPIMQFPILVGGDGLAVK